MLTSLFFIYYYLHLPVSNHIYIVNNVNIVVGTDVICWLPCLGPWINAWGEFYWIYMETGDGGQTNERKSCYTVMFINKKKVVFKEYEKCMHIHWTDWKHGFIYCAQKLSKYNIYWWFPGNKDFIHISVQYSTLSLKRFF